VTAPVPLRFEDVTQDGRLVLEALPNALAPTVWRGKLSETDAARALRRQGIIPILTRLRLLGTEGPFSSSAHVDAEACVRMARTEDGRFVLEMWADLYGNIGRTYGTAERDGQRALAGRVFAEHVLTRPFAPAGQRRVTDLDFDGAPAVATTRAAMPSFESIMALPEGATPLEPCAAPDEVPIAFGVVHTDSNKHVNSLVYLRVFEEAALRRFVSLGRGSSRLARTIDIAYRKPSFAGDVARVVQQAFTAPGGRALGVVATLADARGARPHTFARLGFDA